VHGTVALLVDDAVAGGWTPTAWLGDALPGGRPLPVADALVTRLPGIDVAVRVADCVPVALADADVGIVGVAHAGRVGLLAGVLPATVDAMVSLGARPDRVRAWIGPHVCGDCYEVPRAMADEAERVLPGVAARTSWGTPSLDLGGAAARQLAGLGLAAVERHDPCTMTTPTLFSHRRDGGKAGRQLGAAWLGLPDR
jgi:YfiH family protein